MGLLFRYNPDYNDNKHCLLPFPPEELKLLIYIHLNN